MKFRGEKKKGDQGGGFFSVPSQPSNQRDREQLLREQRVSKRGKINKKEMKAGEKRERMGGGKDPKK